MQKVYFYHKQNNHEMTLRVISITASRIIYDHGTSVWFSPPLPFFKKIIPNHLVPFFGLSKHEANGLTSPCLHSYPGGIHHKTIRHGFGFLDNEYHHYNQERLEEYKEAILHNQQMVI